MMTNSGGEPLNKIRLGGMSADLEGYSIEIDSTGPRPRAYLWYLSMVGHKAAVQAIWAGLVNSPPQSVVLYRENEDPDHPAPVIQEEQTGLRAVMSLPAEGHRTGGWHFLKSQLPAASAYQGVLIPNCAFLSPPMTQSRKESGGSSGEIKEFLLLQPPSLTAYLRKLTATTLPPHQTEAIRLTEMQSLYYTRLNSLLNLPLHPDWAEKLWQRAQANGEINRLECAGAEAYLCRKPDDEHLRQDVADMIQRGKLEC